MEAETVSLYINDCTVSYFIMGPYVSQQCQVGASAMLLSILEAKMYEV